MELQCALYAPSVQSAPLNVAAATGTAASSSALSEDAVTGLIIGQHYKLSYNNYGPYREAAASQLFHFRFLCPQLIRSSISMASTSAMASCGGRL